MKLRIAAAAPEFRLGTDKKASVLDLIRRAKAEEAAVLTLPAPVFGAADEELLARVRELADGMPVYPLTREALSPEELPGAERLDLLCCAADTPAEADSVMKTEELAALVSHDKKCAVALACPLGGDGKGALYDGRCVIAQNGYVLASGEGYISAEVDTARTRLKKPTEEVIVSEDLPKDPWVPLPELLQRAVELQIRGLTDRLTALGERELCLTVDGAPQSLLALGLCARALDRLGLAHKNLHAAVNGRLAGAAAAALGVSPDGARRGLPVAADTLTHIALAGCGYDDSYYVNCNIPETVARLALRSYAATCGDMRLGAVCRESLETPLGSEELDDFFLYYMQKMNLEPQALLKLSQTVFDGPYEPEEIEGRQKAFYRRYRAARLDYPRWPDGPLVFGVALRDKR